jgi:serine/threonine protein kinase
VETGEHEYRTGDQVGGRYLLVARQGAGGMGTVWRAHDEKRGADVALKQLRVPRGADDGERRQRLTRFRREASTLARLARHPHIVNVHELIEAHDEPWLVMELVEGRSLTQVVREEGPLGAARAAALADQLLDALRSVHAQGVVHRDIKPDNVLLTPWGHAVLVDFGIAVHTDDTTLTTMGAVVGTPEYLDPERLRGQRAVPASDLFSLGATLCFAVEGHSPFRRDHPAATFHAILSERPVPMRPCGALGEVIHALLAPEPGDRPDTDQAARRMAGLLADAGPAVELRDRTGPPAEPHWGDHGDSARAVVELREAIRLLHRNARYPSPARVARRGPCRNLSAAEVAEVLGYHTYFSTPSWHAWSAVVQALGGDAAAFAPLWRRATGPTGPGLRGA